VSLKKALGKILVCLVLQVGALGGAPIRQEEIEQLMQMSEPCVTQALRRKEDEPVE
jgi:hypothetical protein